MTSDPDRRYPLPGNHVFEAHDQHDPTKAYYLNAFRDDADNGVYVSFCQDDPGPDRTSSVKSMMWLDADQCEQFAKALLSAAQVIRKS